MTDVKAVLTEPLRGQSAVISFGVQLRRSADIAHRRGGVLDRQHSHSGAPVKSSKLRLMSWINFAGTQLNVRRLTTVFLQGLLCIRKCLPR
jgi:hypothetical protein